MPIWMMRNKETWACKPVTEAVFEIPHTKGLWEMDNPLVSIP